jgi:hypothetical protein
MKISQVIFAVAVGFGFMVSQQALGCVGPQQRVTVKDASFSDLAMSVGTNCGASFFIDLRGPVSDGEYRRVQFQPAQGKLCVIGKTTLGFAQACGQQILTSPLNDELFEIHNKEGKLVARIELADMSLMMHSLDANGVADPHRPALKMTVDSANPENALRVETQINNWITATLKVESTGCSRASPKPSRDIIDISRGEFQVTGACR